MNIYKVSHCPVDVALKENRIQEVKVTRGSAGGHNKLPQHKIDEIVNFIKQFSKYRSHYCLNKSEGKYLALNLRHKAHLNHVYSLRNQMNSDLKLSKNDPTVEGLTFDLQKTHSLSYIPTSIAYYKRQLNFYNLRMHYDSTEKGYFHKWLKHEAGRGTQELGSFSENLY